MDWPTAYNILYKSDHPYNFLLAISYQLLKISDLLLIQDGILQKCQEQHYPSEKHLKWTEFYIHKLFEKCFFWVALFLVAKFSHLFPSSTPRVT